MKKLTLFLVAMTMSLLSFAQSQMSGTYTVGTGGTYDYASMADAGMAIKAAEFTGDVTLLICTDLTETINTGIVNQSEYTLTIRPDKDENRTITYTTATDNTGPTAVFVIGGDMTMTPGSTIGWASVPTKNVIVDGAAEGKTTPRLKITTGKWGTSFLLYGDVQDCVVKNCILENTAAKTANYALTFRSERYSETSKNIGPKNCLVENCELEATHTSKSQTVYFNGSEANSAAGYPANITIRNCNIKAHTRGMFLYGVNGLNVEGCTFDMSETPGGYICHGILGTTVRGTINVRGNKFIKNSTKNASAGEFGLQTITASGGATLWVIENNYFAGYNAVASGTTTEESRLVGIRCGDYCVVRHNTFHMPKLTYAPGTSLVGTHAVALLWLAGSHKYPVQNNIFVCEETAANVSLIRGGLNENVTGNVFYHNGGKAAIVAAAPSCMTFADLETSYPAQAATSKWTNVTFADAANGDLSLAGSSDGDLNLAVDRLPEVLTDITGKNRREKTCAGAYEGREPLPSSITLNAHPVKDYSASIVGTMKRAIQNGENTIVLTHEANGTAHIYNIAHATKTVTEISQEGVVAAESGYLSISDIALTEDDKLVACNSAHCKYENYTASNTSYFYIWDDIAGNPRVWFTSQKSGNYNDAYMGYTMALKGTSQNSVVTISAFNKTNTNARYSHLYVVDGTYSDANYKYSRDNAALHPNTLGKNTYELNASPLAAGKWIVDGELASPIEFVEKNAVAIDTYTALNTNVLGKKYNGASYLANYNEHHLMIAPYADGDGKLAGVKVLGITDGLDAATQVTTNTDLTNAVEATAAAATAYVDGDGDLTIYLIADGKVYTFSEKEFTTPQYTINAHADHTSKGYVTGGGDYYEGEEVVLKATAKSGYYFTQWNDGNTDNPRTITVNGDAEYIAEFAEAHPRAWAYDMKLGEDGDNYTFTFKATAAGQATITFKDKDGNALAQPASQTMPTVVGENKFTIAKSDFESGVDAFWFITMDGDPIPAIAEVTDQTRGIYDFYNMMGVVVDNNTDSKDFGKIYIQQSYERSYASSSTSNNGITTRANEQTSGIFIYNQALDELNSPSNVGIKPTMPSGYTEIGSSSSAFQRLNIDPKTGNLVFSHAVSGKPAVFAINRDDMTGDVTNLLTGVADMTRSVAHCFDAEGTLYVMDFAVSTGASTGAVYKVINGEATRITEISAKFVNAYITMASDGRGGLWISQNRGQMDDAPYYYQLVHVSSEGEFDWAVNKETPHGFEGSSSRGALAYDAERNILAQGRNGKVELYTVSYEPTITLTPLHTIASNDLGNNIDGLAFDYAGDLYVVNSHKEKFQKFTLPTADNICTVAAPALEAVRFTPVYTVSVASNNNEWGIANGGGTFEEGETATITAVAATNYKFVKWIKDGAEEFTENPYTFAVTESATYVANFKEKTTYTINVIYDNTMGTVTGDGSYYEGTEVTLTATANTGYRFVNWTYGSETSTNNSLELVVNSDITVTANFVPLQYTLIAPTNDENKGTVTGAGTYNYGTEVTLTANPAAGYKLLYWSDRSTENPRTITMTKNEAISAYFVKEYAEEPTFKIEKMWENTNVPASTNNGYQAVGWDGKIYMKDRLNASINVYTEIGSELYAQLGAAVTGLGGDQPIAVDNAGNLIVRSGSGEFHTPPVQVTILKKDETTGKTIDFTLPATGRCDFISASGDIYSTEGGYVYFYCQYQTTVSRLYIKNGGASAADISVDEVGVNLTAGSSQSHVFTNIFGDLMTHTRDNNYKVLQEVNVATGAAITMNLPNFKNSTLGGCSFELGGKELIAYNIKGTDYNSEWNLYNMTDGEFLSNETLYAKDKVSKKTSGAANWLNVQVVDENTAYIYQFCPEVAVAVWKVSIETPKYTREVTNGDYGTICLPYGSSNYNGAEFYEIAYLELEADGTTPKGIWLDEVTELEAGKPYIFKATADELVVYYEGGEELIPVAGKAGLTGTLEGISHPNDILEGNYMIANNKFWLCGTGCWLNANRAYIKHDALHASTTPVSPMPGRRRVYMGGAGENSATGTEDMIVPNQQVQKVIENGQLIIIRDGVKYNAQGVRL